MPFIKEMYEEVKESDRPLEDLSEIFYCGSPNASILIVSEAPTTSSDNDRETLHEIIRENDKGEKFRKNYPFGSTNHKRNTLYKVFVDDILDFDENIIENKKENIGFTDVSKEPLEDKDLEEKITKKDKEILKKQIEYIQPEIVVCNKKNVSILMDDYFGDEKTLDYGNGKIETSKEITLGNNNIRLIFSSTAHIQMSKFSRKRVSKEIRDYLD